LPGGIPEELKKSRKEMLLKRNQSQPVQFPNAGSIFKNPPGDYAARLIQECGLKGRRVGGAQISDLHANFIINLGDASARDVVELAEIARREVRERFGIELEMEVKLI
jgi:UDP-N-acetylmuramate dehydrogenase